MAFKIGLKMADATMLTETGSTYWWVLSWIIFLTFLIIPAQRWNRARSSWLGTQSLYLLRYTDANILASPRLLPCIRGKTISRPDREARPSFRCRDWNWNLGYWFCGVRNTSRPTSSQRVLTSAKASFLEHMLSALIYLQFNHHGRKLPRLF